MARTGLVHLHKAQGRNPIAPGSCPQRPLRGVRAGHVCAARYGAGGRDVQAGGSIGEYNAAGAGADAWCVGWLQRVGEGCDEEAQAPALAWSAASFWPLPSHRPAASAAASVTRTCEACRRNVSTMLVVRLSGGCSRCCVLCWTGASGICMATRRGAVSALLAPLPTRAGHATLPWCLELPALLKGCRAQHPCWSGL